MRIEAMPEILVGHRVPGPVGLLGIEEDDPRAVVFGVGIGPHIKVTGLGTRLGPARPLEPRVLVRGVVDHQLGNHPQAAVVGFGDKALGVGHGPVVRVHSLVLGNVIAVVAPRRRIERQQPDGVDAQLGDVVELGDQARKVADTVVVGVKERLDVDLIDDGVLVPQRVFDKRGCLRFSGHAADSLWRSSCSEAAASIARPHRVAYDWRAMRQIPKD